MRLKSLKLSGFKSFANPTLFTFRAGITAIVGPNGCGKSNVIDAVRWVLGESSAKQLRGGAMSDVIFAGTQDKPAKSLASVEITFEHTQDEQSGIRHELNLYQELTVRRQVTLEGKSDYFINGTRCRRRDVVDIFLGTGLGPRSYSVIQQGMIGRIVDSSPLQLREFIEEAAGVSRYQVRRTDTQKRLLTTKDNLARLTDIESELISQRQKLVAQADKARAYEATQTELTNVTVELAQLEWRQAHNATVKLGAETEGFSKQIMTKQAELDSVKQALSKKNATLAQAQWLKDAARDALHDRHLQQQTLTHKLTMLEDTVSQLQARQQANENRQAVIDKDIHSREDEANTHAQLMAELTPALEEIRVIREQIAASHAPMQSAWQAGRIELAELEAEKKELEKQQALIEQALTQEKQRREQWQRAQQYWHSEAAKWEWLDTEDVIQDTNREIQPASIKMPNLQTQLDDISRQLASIQRQKDDIAEQLETMQPQRDAVNQTLETQQAKLTTLDKQHGSLIAEYDTLHAIVYRKPSSTSKTLSDTETSAGQPSLSALPNLADSIQLTNEGDGYTELLDKWLTPWLDSRVMEKLTGDQSSLKQIFNTAHVETNDVNSVWFIGDDTADSNSQIGEALNEFFIPLSQLIAMPKLAIFEQCYLYINQNSAEQDEHNLGQVLEQLPLGAMILTPSGWLLTQTGGVHLNKLNGKSNGQNSDFLSQRRNQQIRLQELEATFETLEAQMDEVRASIKQSQSQHEQLLVAMQESSGQLNALVHSQHQYEQQRTTLTAQMQQQQSEHRRLIVQRQQLADEDKALTQTLTVLTTQAQDVATALASLLPRHSMAVSQQEALELKQQQVTQQERDINERYAQMQLELKNTELAAKYASEQLATLKNEQTRLQQMQQTLMVKLITAQQQLPSLQAQVATIEDSTQAQQSVLDAHQATITQLQTDIAKQQTQLATIEAAKQQQQRDSTQCEMALAVAKERLSRAEAHLQSLNLQTPNIESIESIETQDTATVSSQDKTNSQDQNEQQAERLQALTDKAQRLSKRLAGLGPVNLAASAELADIDERLTPLSEQIQDISISMDTLNEAIATIDAKTKVLFLDTLNLVNKSLTQLFTKVFGGGQASLTLVKDAALPKSEQWRAGLELMAQPKGKKNSRLAVLSGGEKTLTALSLIFAIFKQHPAPFCVLDEVDAPLDDANVARFTNLIMDLADEVQFIFISHNKLAMQIADDLKGITMPQAGVSTQVSVSLNEAAQYVDA